MQAAADAVDSGMASVLGLDLDAVQTLCDQCRQPDEVLQPANLLCPGNIAVSGHRAAIERLVPAASEAGAMKVIPLNVAGAFHTSLMEPAVETLRAALAEMPIQDTKIPVYSNVDSAPHQSADEIRDLLSRQVVGPVRWEDSIRRMLADGIEQFEEVGTGRVLRGTLKRFNRKDAGKRIWAMNSILNIGVVSSFCPQGESPASGGSSRLEAKNRSPALRVSTNSTKRLL